MVATFSTIVIVQNENCHNHIKKCFSKILDQIVVTNISVKLLLIRYNIIKIKYNFYHKQVAIFTKYYLLRVIEIKN